MYPLPPAVYPPIEVKSCVILSLWPLDAYTYFWHRGAPDAAMGCAYQRDIDPALDVSERTRVGLIPLGSQAAGEVFKCSLRLNTKEAIKGYNKGI